MDVYGLALEEYFQGKTNEELWIQTSYGELEEMPVEVFFRGPEDMPDLELYALSLCKGTILDIGAGAGSHSLLLQQRGQDVTALEYSARLCDIMRRRKIEKVINTDIFNYSEQRFDTMLLLMNGIGLAGNLAGLRRFLQHTKEIIKPGGQLLLDSSDISYLYEDLTRPADKYYGELSYRYQYKGMEGEWFDWLYIDQEKLAAEASKLGWTMQVLFEDENDQYLARLILY